MRKEIFEMLVTTIFILFLQCFLTFQTYMISFHCNHPAYKLLSAEASTMKKCKILLFEMRYTSFLNSFPNKPWFLHVCSTNLLFSTFLENFLTIFIKFKIVDCKLFQLGRVKNFSFGKGLTHFTDRYYVSICIHVYNLNTFGLPFILQYFQSNPPTHLPTHQPTYPATNIIKTSERKKKICTFYSQLCFLHWVFTFCSVCTYITEWVQN